ncbi:hypothetical protein FA95DRAFT_1613550 [Auriscalpium vulgare]|uniref:Uncharacterized protein n=1 Tax=Auriscalpium vulgare TaxID=40419 RepID=A0ACB8R2A1_9AGAM|nr:hypothetical protein FA95DRAFT_1613550 [Auriscalpium vulgare]
MEAQQQDILDHNGEAAPQPPHPLVPAQQHAGAIPPGAHLQAHHGLPPPGGMHGAGYPPFPPQIPNGAQWFYGYQNAVQLAPLAYGVGHGVAPPGLAPPGLAHPGFYAPYGPYPPYAFPAGPFSPP